MIRRIKKIKLSNILFRNPSNGSLGVVVKDNAILIGGYNHLIILLQIILTMNILKNLEDTR